MQRFIVLLLTVFMVSLATAEEGSDASQKTLVWPDGTRYVGGVENGKRSGKGTIFWQDGTRFVGQFENDMRNGPGTMVLPDGTVYTGFFKDDELVRSPNEPPSSATARTLTSDEEETVAIVSPDPYRGAEVAARFDEPITEITAAVQEELTETVNLWAAAWSDKNVTQYLANYSELFSVPGRQSRSEWEAQRRSRINRPKTIDVDIAYQDFVFVEPDIIDVQFKQAYKSDVYSDMTNKTLRLRREGESWKILRETSR